MRSVGQTFTLPPVPPQGYRAGLVFYSQEENYIAPLLSKVQLAARLSCPAPWRDLPGEAEECDSPVDGTHPLVPLLEKSDHHTCHRKGKVLNVHTMLQRRINHDSPRTSRAFRSSGRISSSPRPMPLQNCLTAQATSTSMMRVLRESQASSPSSECVLVGLRRSLKYSFHCQL